MCLLVFSSAPFSRPTLSHLGPPLPVGLGRGRPSRGPGPSCPLCPGEDHSLSAPIWLSDASTASGGRIPGSCETAATKAKSYGCCRHLAAENTFSASSVMAPPCSVAAQRCAGCVVTDGHSPSSLRAQSPHKGAREALQAHTCLRAPPGSRSPALWLSSARRLKHFVNLDIWSHI